MLKRVISAAYLCLAAAHAQASDLSGQEISELLAGGATVELDTPLGTKVPLRYAADGKLSGDAGSLSWYLGSRTDRGKWWVESGELCHRWSRWFSSEPQCLRLRKHGRLIQWRRQDGQTGTATIILTPKQAPLLASAAPPTLLKEAAPPVPVPLKTPAKPSGPQPEAPAAAKEGVEEVAVAQMASPQMPQLGKPAASPEAPPPPQAMAAAPETDAPPEPEAQSKRAGLRVYKVANVASDDVLNIRSGPSADFDIVAVLRPGTGGIAITSVCRSQWCPVKHHAASGWVNRVYLAPEAAPDAAPDTSGAAMLRDSHDAPRSCLTAAARSLLDRIEQQFGSVQVISTCRPGATIRGTWRPSRHASGNAVDFKAGPRKAAIVDWLIANHRSGGTMTYRDMDHIHVDIGPYFVSIAGGPHWASWRRSRFSGVQ